MICPCSLLTLPMAPALPGATLELCQGVVLAQSSCCFCLSHHPPPPRLTQHPVPAVPGCCYSRWTFPAEFLMHDHHHLQKRAKPPCALGWEFRISSNWLNPKCPCLVLSPISLHCVPLLPFHSSHLQSAELSCSSTNHSSCQEKNLLLTSGCFASS